MSKVEHEIENATCIVNIEFQNIYTPLYAYMYCTCTLRYLSVNAHIRICLRIRFEPNVYAKGMSEYQCCQSKQSKTGENGYNRGAIARVFLDQES